MFRVLITCIALSSALAKAQPSVLKAEEKIEPVRLLEYRDEPDHFIFVGQSARQFHIFDVKNGQVEEIPMTDGASMFDGGSLLLDLEGGRYLFVPSDQKLNYVQGRTESYLLTPGQAREPLMKKKITRVMLENLGLGPILMPPAALKGRPPVQVRETQQTLPASGKLVFIDASKIDHAKRQEFEESLKSLIAATNCARLDQNSQRFYMNTYGLICWDQQAAELKAKIAEPGVTVQEIGSRQDLFSAADLSLNLQDAMAKVANGNASFPSRMSALHSLLNHSAEWVGQRGTFEFAKSIFGIHQILSQAEILSESIVDSLTNEAGMALSRERRLKWNWQTREKFAAEIRARVKTMALYRRVVGPIRAQTLEFIVQIKNLGFEEADRLVLLHAGAAGGGAVIDLLDSRLMDSWLKWWSQNIEPIKDIPEFATPAELETDGWRTSMHSGGVFNQLNLSANMAAVSRWSELSAYSLLREYEIRERNASPLIQLGLKGAADQAIKKVLTFVIQSEEVIEQGLVRLNRNQRFNNFLREASVPESKAFVLREFWLSGTLSAVQLDQLRTTTRHFSDLSDQVILEFLHGLKSKILADKRVDFKGSDILFKFISRLVAIDPQFLLQPEFDQSLYYLSVIEIYKQLLEDSERVLRNQDTYLNVLDSAWYLQNQLLNATPQAVRGKRVLTEAVHELGRTIQYRLASALPTLQSSDRYPAACEILLSPRSK